MFRRKKLIITSIMLTGILADAQTVTLDALIELAINNNSNVKISQYKKDTKDASLKIVKAGYYPTIALLGEMAQYDIDSGSSQVDDTVKGVTLSANQLIYDFGKTSNSISAAEKDLSAAQEDVAVNLSTTILQTKQAYYDILREEQRVTLYQEMEQIDALRLEQVQAYHVAGIRTLIDVTDAKLKLSNSKLNLLDSQYSLKEYRASLNAVIGVDDGTNYEIEKDPNIMEVVGSIKDVQSTLDYLKEEGIKNRPEIKLYEKQIYAQEHQLQSIRSEYYPSLEIDASYNDKDSDKIASLNTKQMSAGLYLKWNVFTGNTTQANIKNYMAQIASLKQQLFQEKIDIRKAISISYFRLKSNEDSIEISFLAVEFASQKLDLANQRYKAGISDSVELNDARLEYSEAKSTLIDNYYNHLDSKAQLEYSIGKFNTY